MFKRFVKLMNDSKGATAIEYGLIAAGIAVAIIAAVFGFGGIAADAAWIARTYAAWRRS